jgi:hypothetical protein
MRTLAVVIVMLLSSPGLVFATPSAPLATPSDLMTAIAEQLSNARRAERDLNGPSLNASLMVAGQKRFVERVSLTRTWLVDGELFKPTLFGLMHGQQLVGTVLQARLEDGRRVRVRIDGSERSGDSTSYLVSVQLDAATKGPFRPLCKAENGEPTAALALAGYWRYGVGIDGGAHVADATSFTFACSGHVLAKCALAGYAPWKKRVVCGEAGCRTRSLRGLHQACTRMLRADYCGDGRSHTVAGVPLSFADQSAVRVATIGSDIEAVWGPNGVLLASALRVEGRSPVCSSRRVAARSPSDLLISFR